MGLGASREPGIPVVRQKLKDVISVRTLMLARAPSFDDVFAPLKTPGIHPHVDSGYGRFTEELTKIDPFRDNWWCSSNSVNRDSPGAPFLPADARVQAAAEWQKLQSVPTAPD